MLVAGYQASRLPQLTRPSNSLPSVAGRPSQGAVYGWRYTEETTDTYAARASRQGSGVKKIKQVRLPLEINQRNDDAIDKEKREK
jgi:hypothetical protein